MSFESLAVAGRECGACTACCVELAIVTDDMVKMEGVACRHCQADGGCAIYAARPQLCREYFCGWRCIPALDDAWRPDLSGVMILHEPPVPGYDAPLAISLVVLGGPEVVESDRFAMLVAGFIDRGTPTHLNLPGKAGFWSHKQLLNEDLAPAIRARELARVKALIWGFYAHLRSRPPVAKTEAHVVQAWPADGGAPAREGGDDFS